ncbi:hypothetical protein CACET_c12950 [Clostridium aceticum]|uniref:Uncharacterized protein n=1 Tax=Clostridium aceticum TaxID=84022 RepID=A0A0D8ICJ8_9CLOT|nr:hypothetical protein [Clostridium aceticum]AKL94760.1 hypothetical protein CACET_c12950 [Clostridium aceticum]KJF27707.1 hypothetical protein TZ02_03605 [Clostridium aceticum]
MAEIVNTNRGYTLDFILLPSQHIGEFNDFMMQYGDKSDYDIFKEIAEVKGKVSQDLLKQHTANLNALSQMNGFVTDMTQERIEVIKEILAEDTGSSNNVSNIDSQFFFGGSSLLLWFLILAGIWRRPFWGFSRGFF